LLIAELGRVAREPDRLQDVEVAALRPMEEQGTRLRDPAEDVERRLTAGRLVAPHERARRVLQVGLFYRLEGREPCRAEHRPCKAISDGQAPA
jgi:hypothetical protein